MKIKLKKSCSGCLALRFEWPSYKCKLGCRIYNGLPPVAGSTKDVKPAQICPKPRTYKLLNRYYWHPSLWKEMVNQNENP